MEGGLAPKTIKNIHRMLHRAFGDAVAWDYLTFNPTTNAVPHAESHNGSSRGLPTSSPGFFRLLGPIGVTRCGPGGHDGHASRRARPRRP
jgi:hypothetical protein